jgi:chromosome partitioning protein
MHPGIGAFFAICLPRQEHEAGDFEDYRRLQQQRRSGQDGFLDCPPSISLVSENIFRASDAILVPMIPTTLSARSLGQLMEFLEGHARLERLPVMPLFTMVDRRKRLHLELMELLRVQYPEILGTPIPYASEVERMGVHRMPLPAYAPSNAATKAYRALWDEVKMGLTG